MSMPSKVLIRAQLAMLWT